MSDSRLTGLALMGVATAAFLGSTSEMLPAATFFPALALFAIGAFKFLRSNSEALARAERKTQQRVTPRIRQNRHTQAHAERMAGRSGHALASVSETGAQGERGDADRSSSEAIEAIAIRDDATDLVVTGDVSFPLEVQQGDALADQLKKLNQLMAQGVLTEEEYAVAKAKLLA